MISAATPHARRAGGRWPIEPDRRPTLEAVVGHDLAFATWRSLAEGGLTDDQVVTILVGLVEGVVDGSILRCTTMGRRRRTQRSNGG